MRIQPPSLVWPGPGTNASDWTIGWATAFDVEKVTRKFYEEYKLLFDAIEQAIAAENGVEDGEDLRMFTQTLVNRLMFLRFLERKGWLKFGGNEKYLRALYDAGPFGKKSFYRGRLMPLFFEGLAIDRSALPSPVLRGERGLGEVRVHWKWVQPHRISPWPYLEYRGEREKFKRLSVKSRSLTAGLFEANELDQRIKSVPYSAELRPD